jgi:hypothetical protein
MNNHSLRCGHCGAALPVNAQSCKRCGSSDSDGWSDNAYEGDLEEDFDYDEFVENEFSEGHTSTSLHPFWRTVVFVLLALFLLLAILQF